MNDISRIGWRLVMPASERPMDDIEALDQLRIEHDRPEEIELIRLAIDSAVEAIESRGHILMPQTWEMLLDAFPCGKQPILLFKNPVASVDFVKYIDSDGVEQTWDPADYKAALTSIPARIVPAYGQCWPTARCEPEAVTVRITAGYDSSPMEIPRVLMSAVRILMSWFHEHRGEDGAELPESYEKLIYWAIGRARVY